jgi:hypothetical protein
VVSNKKPKKTAPAPPAPVNHPVRDIDEIGTRELARALRQRVVGRYWTKRRSR